MYERKIINCSFVHNLTTIMSIFCLRLNIKKQTELNMKNMDKNITETFTHTLPLDELEKVLNIQL